MSRNPNISQLLAETLATEMRRDDRIVLLGEDVGAMGGTFGTTRGLQGEFGEWRVRDTPIAEMSFTGLGVGLAMAGWRPIVEIMFADFLGVCLEQIYNAMAKIPYMSGGTVQIPMVVKTAAGCIGSAAQHSQCLWGTVAHLPGMRVVVPSNPHDYRGLLASAVRSDDPVVFFEHKGLLLRRAASFAFGSAIPSEPYAVPLGEAEVVRPGADVTVVTIGASVEHAVLAADRVAADGLDVEVLDLRCLVPLDVDTVVGSVARTRRLLVVDEDYTSFGLSGEIVARVIERLSPSGVDAVMRHATPDVPIPAARSLEEAMMPGVESIAARLRELAHA